VGKIAWHWDDDCEKLRNFAHASTPRSGRVGKIARRRAIMMAVPGNYAHPTAVRILETLYENLIGVMKKFDVLRARVGRRLGQFEQPRRRARAASPARRDRAVSRSRG